MLGCYFVGRLKANTAHYDKYYSKQVCTNSQEFLCKFSQEEKSDSAGYCMPQFPIKTQQSSVLLGSLGLALAKTKQAKMEGGVKAFRLHLSLSA